MKNLKYRFCK